MQSLISYLCLVDVYTFSTFTVATDGKQPPAPDGGGGGGDGVGGGGGATNSNYCMLFG